MSLPGWNDLRHGGLLLDAQRQSEIAAVAEPRVLNAWLESEARRRADRLRDTSAASNRDRTKFVTFVLEHLCGFKASDAGDGWLRGSRIPTTWSRRALTGESVRPSHLWLGPKGAVLPVFVTGDKQVGIGRGRRETSRALGWLRAGNERLALLTNGRQWRLLFAGLDFDAWCQWDTDLWFAEGAPTPALNALLTLIQPSLWTPVEEGADPPLLRAVRDSRKGQSELSEALGERVREAVERLIQGHGEALVRECATVDKADIYRAACRVVMRLVVILFAEARGLLPRNDAVYHDSYGLGGLHESLRRRAAAGRSQAQSYGAWPRLLALFELVRKGSHHPDLAVPAYGGDLFAPGQPTADDGLSRALAVFETACLGGELLSDAEVHEMLERLTRTQVRIRQGKASRLVAAPVDFSDLSTEYIGVLYEGLLDYELKTAPRDDSIIFLAVGEQPALPLSRLEEMDDKALRSLFAAMKKSTGTEAASVRNDTPATAVENTADADALSLGARTFRSASSAKSRSDEPEQNPAEPTQDPRQTTRTRAEAWARHAALTAGLVKKPRRSKSQATLPSTHEDELAKRAASLVNRVVLPDEWYLVRWGGTRKGSGSFYTRPGLTVPTVQRTLRPLAYDPPLDDDGKPNREAPPTEWIPKRPEAILSLKVCDPACGSGSFPLAALRFLTDALYASVRHHSRIEDRGDISLVRLLGLEDEAKLDSTAAERPGDELIPCPPDADDFEPRLRAVLRRYVVERCIYGVDVDPLAVSLCQLSLWIETMDRDLPFSFLDHKIRCGNSLIGAWFDQFQHYPAMAWKNREAGDKNHSNGVHYRKGAQTKAIKAWVRNELTPDLRHTLEGRTLFHEDLLEQAAAAHGAALEGLERMHRLPIRDSAARARLYRDELTASDEWRSLKNAMDLWCACWFWPADELDCAPLPTTFTDPAPETRAVAERIAAEMRFFHWELEFPDVFREEEAGFHAMLGNPPWDIAKPKSQEFFSSIDPLYRSYGKQEALRRQNGYFDEDPEIERDWLDYNARFRAQSNFVTCAASPFGDPEENDKSQRRFAAARGKANLRLHDGWREARQRSRGYADAEHTFRHQGSADLNLYKLFLEQTHALLKEGGRLGFVVPSGLYSDQGTGALRDLFLEHCAWEWLFGFENRLGMFPIHRSYKFNPVIVQKGGATASLRTVFMRRDLTDWEQAEEFAVPYSREQVRRFSPNSRAILEIESQRDLEVLEKIYKNSVLLGDDGPDGWGIRYATEFHMTNDSKLFPPRPQWEAKGYRPDEYSRWLLGNWRPIDELWAELGVDPDDPEPEAVKLEDWLCDFEADIERREAERTFIHGHLLAPGDVEVTGWHERCAQPPYDQLPVPRAVIPEGIILSREADAWVRETGIEDVALPLYQGVMFYNRLPNVAQHVRGSGHSAEWRRGIEANDHLQPQFLLSEKQYRSNSKSLLCGTKVAVRSLARATDLRTIVAGVIPDLPAGNSVNYLTPDRSELRSSAFSVLSSLLFDWQSRIRIAGTNMNFHFLEEMALPITDGTLGTPGPTNAAAKGPTAQSESPGLASQRGMSALAALGRAPLGLALTTQAATQLEWSAVTLALLPGERYCRNAVADALVAAAYGLDRDDLAVILEDCDHPAPHGKSTGFWRVDKDKPPELRHTILTQIAFADLQQHIAAAGGDREAGIHAFMDQNHGEGWLLPETLRLADHSLGHDHRATEHQPVATELGPRFYDWQLAQPPQEASAETHLHARNLLGEHGYCRLLAELKKGSAEQPPSTTAQPLSEVAEEGHRWDDWLSAPDPSDE